MIYYFSTKTNNTKTFVENLNWESVAISRSLVKATDPFVLAIATYADSKGKHPIPKLVIEFIKENNQLLRGVIAGGNRNFGKLFGLSGDIISRNCKVPLLHKFELRGTIEDVHIVNDKLMMIFNEMY